jgi:hypothetical protein
MTIYAVDQSNSTVPVTKIRIWQSTDGGISWNPRLNTWLAQTQPQPVPPFAEVAMAPDNPDFIAVVSMDATGTHRRQVYISEDGGH